MSEQTPFRQAVVGDAIFVEELLREFVAKTDAIEYSTLSYRRSSSLQSIQATIERGIGLVGPNSCAAAILLPWDLDYSLTLAWVQFWAFRKIREAVILKALMDACRARGATHFVAASHYPHNRVLRFYKKLGLKEFEIQSICSL